MGIVLPLNGEGWQSVTIPGLCWWASAELKALSVAFRFDEH